MQLIFPEPSASQVSRAERAPWGPLPYAVATEAVARVSCLRVFVLAPALS